jgi:hypothetical protein
VGQSFHEDAGGDHVHEVGVVDNQLARISHFDYDEVDRNLGFEPEPDSTVTMSDAAACFSLILEWILKGETLHLAGARAAALAIYLDPVNNSKFGSSLAEIAREADCTRAALSKSLIDFRDAAGVYLSMGKRSDARKTFRSVQVEAIEKGTHSSFKRQKKIADAKV